MSFARAIVAGAGLAGLGAAVRLAEAGVGVELSDGAAQAGGRCRSYFDAALGLTVDNGNHLVLAGNRAVTDYRRMIGANEPLAGPDHADFAFAELASGQRWTVRINDGPLPWWVLSKRRRVPGTGVADYLALARLMNAHNGRIDEAIAPRGFLWERLLAPVLLAALNTPPEEASAALARAVLAESIALGGLAARPRIACPTLGAGFIDPALNWLELRGVRLASRRRLRAIEFTGDAITALCWSDGRQEVAADTAVILAVPAWSALELVPRLIAPTEHRAIVNAHFAYRVGTGVPAMLGLIGANAEWVFVHEDRVSVTISAADAIVGRDREELAQLLWAEVKGALGISAPLPPWQIVKERRATFAATPQQDSLRPGSRTRWRNLFLAGDWVQNGLPATIEGALRSGDTAARLALGRPLLY